MVLTKQRHEQLLYKLLEAEQYITIDDLARDLEVSTRTIRRDLDKLERHLEQDQIELMKKPGSGIWLKTPSRERYRLKQELGVIKDDALGPESRVRWLIKELVFGAQEYSIGSLEDKLHISRSTVYNDLEDVEQWLQQYNLSLIKEQNKFVVTGREKDIRIAVVNLMLELLDQEAKETIVDLLQEGAGIRTEDHKILQEFCLALDLKFVRELVGFIEDKLEIVFTTRALLHLCLYLAVSFKRIDNKNEVSLTSTELKELKEKDLFVSNKIIASKVEDELGIKLTESEIGCNVLQMLAAELYSADSLVTKADIKEQIKTEIVSAVEDVVYYIKYNLEFKDGIEYNFFKNMVLYIRSLYYTKKYNIRYQDTSQHHIQIIKLQEEYPYLFRMVEASFDILNDRLGIKLEAGEIKAVALILLTVIEQKKSLVKTVVVFDGSAAWAQLMEARLNRRVPRLKIVDWVYFSQLQELPQKVDLIISTREIEWSDDVMVISPLVEKADVKRIVDKIEILSDLDTYFGS